MMADGESWPSAITRPEMCRYHFLRTNTYSLGIQLFNKQGHNADLIPELQTARMPSNTMTVEMRKKLLKIVRRWRLNRHSRWAWNPTALRVWPSCALHNLQRMTNVNSSDVFKIRLIPLRLAQSPCEPFQQGEDNNRFPVEDFEERNVWFGNKNNFAIVKRAEESAPEPVTLWRPGAWILLQISASKQSTRRAGKL